MLACGVHTSAMKPAGASGVGGGAGGEGDAGGSGGGGGASGEGGGPGGEGGEGGEEGGDDDGDDNGGGGSEGSEGGEGRGGEGGGLIRPTLATPDALHSHEKAYHDSTHYDALYWHMRAAAMGHTWASANAARLLEER